MGPLDAGEQEVTVQSSSRGWPRERAGGRRFRRKLGSEVELLIAGRGLGLFLLRERILPGLIVPSQEGTLAPVY